jgi:hypothetical protein
MLLWEGTGRTRPVPSQLFSRIPATVRRKE